MRDKRHALLLSLLLLWKWKCCCCSWYANTRQVGHLRRSAVKLCVCVCVCVTYNQLQISGSRLKWLQPFYQAQLHARGVSVCGTRGWGCRGPSTWANSRFALINAQLWLLLAFIYIAKKGCSFISLFPQLTRSFLYVIVIVRNIIMDNQSINNIMRQVPLPSFQALVLSMLLIVLLLKRGLRLIWHLQM